MANRARALASAIFKFGMKVGVIEENPVGQVDPFLTEQPKERGLTLAELATMVRLLAKEETAASDALQLMLLTVQRSSDILSMRWVDITFETWQLRESDDKALRQFPLSGPVLQVLRRRFAATGGEGFVFPSRHTADNHLQYLGKALARVQRQMHLDWNCTFYDLRRSIEVRLRELRIRPDVVELLLNRQTAFKRLKASSGHYDYTEDVKAALTIWAKAIMPLPAPSRADPENSKVIQLFPRKPSN